MNRIFKYGIWALAVLAVPAVLQSCHDDKDIVVIDEELLVQSGEQPVVQQPR